MTIASGSLILADDYNNILSSADALWTTGGGPAYLGYGQPSYVPSTTAGSSSVTAQQWSLLQNLYSRIIAHQGNPETGNLGPTPEIGATVTSGLGQITAAVPLINQYSGWAAANGNQYTAWSGTVSKNSNTAQGLSVLSFTSVITFASANSSKYFFNAGGRIKIEFSKSSTGLLGDADWNNMALNVMPDLYITLGGPPALATGGSVRIAGSLYQGFDGIGGTGTPAVYQRATGWWDLTPGAAYTLAYRQYSPNTPYNNNRIDVYVAKNVAGTELSIMSEWWNIEGDAYSGGTSPVGPVPGTAPCMLVTYFPPSLANLTTNSWGTPLINGTVDS